jgi:hypothetical protein
MSERSTDEDVTELRGRARRVRVLSHHFLSDGGTAKQLRAFADELEQRARDIEAGRPIGKTSGAT